MRGDEFFAGIATHAPFTKLHPAVAAFLKGYLQKEKVIRFRDHFVLNTNFPPYPSPAFEQLVEQFAAVGIAASRRLYSVTLAVTNRCSFNCWHCYNAGRAQKDVALSSLQGLARDLQKLGAVMVTLTGGEPLLRKDLGEIAASFGPRSCLILGTTGDGLTRERAQELRTAGVFGVGISLDSDQPEEHDRLRGRQGAFEIALRALQIARENDLYPYVVSVAAREFLEQTRFLKFLRFAAQAGALEVHLLEPAASGKLTGRTELLLTGAERQRILEYQAEVAADAGLPILSSFAYLESPEAFGCGAGLTHIYIDGSGEVCPCNLVPLSFGNCTEKPLGDILAEMGEHFCRPRVGCVGRLLARQFCSTRSPAPPELSHAICRRHLPSTHEVPAFFRVRDEAQDRQVGTAELRQAYDRVHSDYDEFWLSAAAAPIEDLVNRMTWASTEEVFEAGCGTGYATALLAARAKTVVAVDLSAGMQAEARHRVRTAGLGNVRFVTGDALAALAAMPDGLDRVFSSWVLGYIPLNPFFAAAFTALREGGQLAFVVHRENSPREPMDLFSKIVAEDPTVLRKRVAFDFPRGAEDLSVGLKAAGFEIDDLWEDQIVFRYSSAEEVLEHLLKSGAGTAFYDALDPLRRPALTARFLEGLRDRHVTSADFLVRHDYVSCIARKP